MGTKRFFLFLFFLISKLLFSQDTAMVGQLNKIYSNYYYTRIVALSDNGNYFVGNNTNQYGLNEYKLYNTVTKQNVPIIKAKSYHFLSDTKILIECDSIVRFQNLNDAEIKDVKGSALVRLPKDRSYVLLFYKKKKTLVCYNQDGSLRWERTGIDFFDENAPDDKYIIYKADNKFFKIDMLSRSVISCEVPESLKWVKSDRSTLYSYSGDAYTGYVYLINGDFTGFSKIKIEIPEGFQWDERKREYLEIREKRYLIMALTPNRSFVKKQDSNVVISYTTHNSQSNFPSQYLAVYDLESSKWVWKPSFDYKNPFQAFLNDKGDFLIYDQADDVIENLANPLAKITLVRNYGSEKYEVGSLHTDESSYHWDAESGRLLFFKNEKWWCFHAETLHIHELFNIPEEKWVTEKRNGMMDMPRERLVITKNSPKVVIRGRYDLYMVDLMTHKMTKITNGEKDKVSYKIVHTQRAWNSSWNNRTEGVDLAKEVIFQMFNTKNYDTGFATYKNKHLKTLIFNDENFKELKMTKNNTFAISQSYQKPIKITRIKGRKNNVIFDNLQYVLNSSEDTKMKLFSYSTSSDTKNAVLLYPKNYDSHKQYPMIVNVYEDKSKEILQYSIPDLLSDTGFNFMHYVHQGYFVLLPEINYEIGKVYEKLTESLEESIKASFDHGNIDRDHIAVVGMSFGGYETALALSGSNLFKTGVAGVMVADLVSMALSNSRVQSQPNYVRIENDIFRMGGSLFDNWNLYNEQSPIFHLKGMNKPILLWTGLNDNNVSPAQTKAYFLGLKRLGGRGILLEYPEEGHTLLNPLKQEDLNVRTWQWMEYFLKNKPPSKWMLPIINRAP